MLICSSCFAYMYVEHGVLLIKGETFTPQSTLMPSRCVCVCVCVCVGGCVFQSEVTGKLISIPLFHSLSNSDSCLFPDSIILVRPSRYSSLRFPMNISGLSWSAIISQVWTPPYVVQKTQRQSDEMT